MKVFTSILKILAHIGIVISGMYIVLNFIDNVNSAMTFIENGITEGLLFTLAVLIAVNTVMSLMIAKHVNFSATSKTVWIHFTLTALLAAFIYVMLFFELITVFEDFAIYKTLLLLFSVTSLVSSAFLNAAAGRLKAQESKNG